MGAAHRHRPSKTGGGLNKITVQLTDDLLERLDRDAEAQGMSRSVIVTKLLERGWKGQEEDQRMTERVREFIGSGFGAA